MFEKTCWFCVVKVGCLLPELLHKGTLAGSNGQIEAVSNTAQTRSLLCLRARQWEPPQSRCCMHADAARAQRCRHTWGTTDKQHWAALPQAMWRLTSVVWHCSAKAYTNCWLLLQHLNTAHLGATAGPGPGRAQQTRCSELCWAPGCLPGRLRAPVADGAAGVAHGWP